MSLTASRTWPTPPARAPIPSAGNGDSRLARLMSPSRRASARQCAQARTARNAAHPAAAANSATRMYSAVAPGTDSPRTERRTHDAGRRIKGRGGRARSLVLPSAFVIRHLTRTARPIISGGPSVGPPAHLLPDRKTPFLCLASFGCGGFLHYSCRSIPAMSREASGSFGLIFSALP